MVGRIFRDVTLSLLIILWLFTGCYPLTGRGLSSDLTTAQHYLRTGNYDEAIAVCDRSLEKEPDNSSVLNTRACAKAGMGDYEGALPDAKRACEISPWSLEFQVDLGLIASRAYDFETSLAAYEKVLERNPTGSGQAYNGRAWANLQLGRLDTVLEDVNKSLELEPENHNAIDTRAVYYLKTGDFDKALEDINRAIELAPDYPEHHYHKGMIYTAMENWVDAYDELNIAYRADPNLRDIEDLLAAAEEKVAEIFEKSGAIE